MAVVQKDAQLEALEAAEKELDLQLAKQEKLAAIAEKQQRLEALAASSPGGATAATVTTTTATLTVKKGSYHEHREAHSSTKSSGISAGLGKDVQLGYNQSKGNTAELQWTKNTQVEGSLPINLNNTNDNTATFLAAMGVTTEQILALKHK